MNTRTLPDGLVHYQNSPIFDQDSTPTRLQKSHDTKAGTWGKIKVKSGRLHFVIEETGDAQWLDSTTDGLIAPQQLHHIEIIEPVCFYLEFYRVPD